MPPNGHPPVQIVGTPEKRHGRTNEPSRRRATMRCVNWRAVDWVTRVLMVVVFAFGVVFFLQDTAGRQATLCFVIVLVLSLLGRYAASRRSQANLHDPSRQDS